MWKGSPTPSLNNGRGWLWRTVAPPHSPVISVSILISIPVLFNDTGTKSSKINDEFASMGYFVFFQGNPKIIAVTLSEFIRNSSAGGA